MDKVTAFAEMLFERGDHHTRGYRALVGGLIVGVILCRSNTTAPEMAGLIFSGLAIAHWVAGLARTKTTGMQKAAKTLRLLVDAFESYDLWKSETGTEKTAQFTAEVKGLMATASGQLLDIGVDCPSMEERWWGRWQFMTPELIRLCEAGDYETAKRFAESQRTAMPS